MEAAITPAIAVTHSHVTLDIAYPDRLSRGKALLKLLLGWLYVGLPHGILLFLFGIATGVVTFIAFWIVLFTGRYPRGLFNFVVEEMRWTIRVTAYMSFLRDEYPPFNGKP